MLTIKVPDGEFFDDAKEEFVQVKGRSLRLEHSLVSISKWESKWKKPYLSRDKKTPAEIVDYVRCMTLDQNVDPNLYLCLSSENFKSIQDYIDDPMTATTINDLSKHGIQKDIITSEIIYYWMVALSIPQEYRKWHLNRLITLINVCNIKNQAPKKMPKNESMALHRATNAARRKKHSSRG